MACECYYPQCPHHGTQETPPDEGPFCHEPECKATDEQLEQWGRERRIKRLGYDPDALESDNPYNQWMKGLDI